MRATPIFLSRHYWLYAVSIKRALASAFTAFGVLWLAVQIISFFSTDGAEWLRSRPLLFGTIGLVYAIWNSRPVIRVVNTIAGRDVHIELRVADIFGLPGAVVVSTNTTFETDMVSGLIAKDTIQGAFTSLYYDSADYLRRDLELQLPSGHGQQVVRAGKTLLSYAVGTTARVTARDRVGYFVALTVLNDHGTASATFDDLKRALPTFWEFVAARGNMETLLVPILGSGRARIPQKRDVIIREIVQSFVAACSDHRFCDSLVIVISPKDFREHDLDLKVLGAFVRHICTYTEFKTASARGTGTGIG